MMEVLSERSSRVVSYAKLQRASVRRDEGQFLVEGANSVDAALTTHRAELVLVSEDEERPLHSALATFAAFVAALMSSACPR
mgnify:CR=1 FL=1